jgi:antirestriction protein ArdC
VTYRGSSGGDSNSRRLLERVTAGIIAELKAGAPPWVRPWRDEPLRPQYDASTGRRYKSLNTLLLWQSSRKRGYRSDGWLNSSQIDEQGGHVRAGEVSTTCYWSIPRPRRGPPSVLGGGVVGTAGGGRRSGRRGRQESEGGLATRQLVRREAVASSRPLLLPFEVFNLEQVDDLPPKYYDQQGPSFEDPLSGAERMLRSVRARVVHGGNIAAYNQAKDYILMPRPEQFVSLEHYYATSLHEHVHWTGHPLRLRRSLARGRQGYAFEELVAELGAAFLCAFLGLRRRIRHAGYIDHWVTHLNDRTESIFWAAQHAEEAAEYIEKPITGADERRR